MKIVKVTPRFKMYRLGFKYALRFAHYDQNKTVSKLFEMYGVGGPYNKWNRTIPNRRDATTRNYLTFIYLRDEADITLLQLAGAFDEEN